MKVEPWSDDELSKPYKIVFEAENENEEEALRTLLKHLKIQQGFSFCPFKQPFKCPLIHVLQGKTRS